MVPFKQGSESAGQRGSFPLKAALALACAVVVLFLVHWWPNKAGNRTRGIDFEQFPYLVRHAAELKLPHRPVPPGPLNGVQRTQAQTPAPTHPTADVAPGQTPSAGTVPAPLLDGTASLDPFFAQLWKLEQHQGPKVVTVLHYGDSPTTADLITGDLREILQERFGDAGHGFNLAAKPWAWYGHRDVEIHDSGWASSQKDATGVGKMKPSVYGLGGAIFSGGAGAETIFKLKGAPQTALEIDYLAGEGNGALTVSGDGAELATIDTNAAATTVASRAVNLPADTKTVKLAVTAGTVKLFGVDFRRGDSGVIYDSLGLNGATTTVISRTFDTDAWKAELQNTKPSLIVINYGTNESQFAGLVSTLEKELHDAIAKTRAAAPGVPILIMSPMDRGEHGGMNDIHTNAAIPQIVAIQRKVAIEEHCAFFNTYAAMGGDGTMARWYAASPRLVTADLIHPTPQGAVIVARLFIDNLYAAYDQWKAANRIGVVRVLNATEAAAKKQEEAARAKAEAARTRELVRVQAQERRRKKVAPKAPDTPGPVPH